MWVQLSLVALLVAAALWIIGDALIVGFKKPDPERFADFIELMGDDAYAYQLSASEPRLRWGALVANYSVPLMLLGLYAHGYLVRDSLIGIIGVVIVGIGMSLSPLAHATFYFLGLASHRAWNDFTTGTDTSASALHAQQIFHFLTWVWGPAAGLTALGGFLFSIPLALGNTTLPWWSVLFTPLVLSIPGSQLKRIPYPGKPLLDGALFNLALFGWALAFLTLSIIYPVG
ncbi:MAG: hypothetical protein Q4P71_09925 [Actinomycetaceae bacterium]|nr:hypothetical protein [Actinomycetaceae bacterium]